MDGKTQTVEESRVLPYQTNMWFQLKTLLTSILLLMALCFGASSKQAGHENWIGIGALVVEGGSGVVAAIRGGEVLGKLDFSKPLAKTQAPSVNYASPGGVAGNNASVAGKAATNRLPAQITLNREAGIKFENQVVDALSHVGGTKNTAPFTVPISGRQVTTIPDLWGRNVGGILEAKNVLKLSLSPQLRAQTTKALNTGQPFNLVVSPRTQTVSKPLREAVEKTGGGVHIYDPATDTLSAFK